MDQVQPEQTWGERGALKIYERSTRRGFLAKTGAALVAFGLADFTLAKSANAAPTAPYCCRGAQCASCPGTCPSTTSCPSGYTYTNYKWSCCYSGRVYICRDCKNSAGSVCVCACQTQTACDAAGSRTATELSMPVGEASKR